MSDSFFNDVSRFFNLLDLSHDSALDRLEATLGLSLCFEAVHQIKSTIDGPPINKQQTVTDQVNWLFTAASTNSSPRQPSHSTSTTTTNGSSSPNLTSLSNKSTGIIDDDDIIDLRAFKSCYEQLLQSAYEEEVLHLDLKRGIKALQESDEWKLMISLLNTVREKLYSVITSSSSPSSIIQSIFTSILSSGGGQLPPKKATTARKIVTTLITEVSQSGNIGVRQLLKIYKQLLVTGVPVKLLISDLAKVVGGEGAGAGAQTGAGSSSSSSSSSSSNSSGSSDSDSNSMQSQ